MKSILTDSGSLSQSAGVITATSLSVNSVGSVNLSDNNSTSTLAAEITGGSANNFTYVNNPGSAGLLTIGTVNSINGINTSTGNGNISVTNDNGGLTVSQAINSGTGTTTLTTGWHQ